MQIKGSFTGVNIIMPVLYKANLILFLLLTPSIIHARSSGLNGGIIVLKDEKSYQEAASTNPFKPMVEVQKYVAGIKTDLRYATRENFMHTELYPPIAAAYVRLPVAKALEEVQKELKRKGLGLKVFDAYRPYSVTVKMWELIKDERYVADPGKGSGHNRGIAVDLTLIELNSNIELDMGTGFDNFTDTAHQDFTGLSPKILSNRKILKTVMEKHGFTPLKTEWWHYSLLTEKEFEVLDLGFSELKKIVK